MAGSKIRNRSNGSAGWAHVEHEAVVAGAAGKSRCPRAAAELVRAAAPEKDIVAGAPVELVGATAAVEPVGAGGAGQPVRRTRGR